MWYHRKFRKYVFADHKTILCQFIADFHIIFQVIKIHVVVKHQLSTFFIIGNNSYRTIYILVFQQSCVYSSVRIYQSIHTEIAVMDLFSMISSISIDCLSILGSTMSNCMVTPFPDKTTTHFIVVLNHLEIIFKISRSISHAVAVLDQKEWLASVLVQIFLNFGKCRVHPAVHIQIAVIICFIIITVSCTLILCDAVWIIILCPF